MIQIQNYLSQEKDSDSEFWQHYFVISPHLPIAFGQRVREEARSSFQVEFTERTNL